MPKRKVLHQAQVVESLEAKVRAAMRKLERQSVNGLAALWNKTREDIKAGLIVQYKTAAPTGRWEYAHAKATGALYRMERVVMRHMEDFRARAKEYIRAELKKHYTHEYATAAYILDQVTPPCCEVKLKPGLTEAQVRVGPAAMAQWFQRFDGWANAWESSLKSNLMLNAINNGDIDSVVNDVDGTRIGTPAVTFWDAMGRLFLTEMLQAQADARGDMARLNDDLVAEEIWQTMEDERVCDICGPLNGKTREEVEDEDTPAHPNCRCFWRVMPKDWLALSRNDWELAHALDVAGAVPDGMYIRDPDTEEIKAAVVVSFETWAKDKITLAGR